jgi:glycerol-3-phosphate dehydrogenase
MTTREARADALERLAEDVMDVLVVGGGIIGCRVACEAARSGLTVALIDAGDFGSATSGASSKLIHGGLRYLATGDVRLVRELQVERNALATRVAPHLVQPLPLLLAVERSCSHRVPKLMTALAVYAAISGFSRPGRNCSGLPRPRASRRSLRRPCARAASSKRR